MQTERRFYVGADVSEGTEEVEEKSVEEETEPEEELVNPLFYTFYVKANAFAAGDACTGCGRCAVRCPMNNITLRGGRPVWGKACTHCMACICYCPTSAIEYGKKSLGKPRYHFEAL